MKCLLGLPEENLSLLPARLEAEDGILKGRKQSCHHVEPKMEVNLVEDKTQKRKNLSSSDTIWALNPAVPEAELTPGTFSFESQWIPFVFKSFELGFLSLATGRVSTETPGQGISPLQIVGLAFSLGTSVFWAWIVWVCPERLMTFGCTEEVYFLNLDGWELGQGITHQWKTLPKWPFLALSENSVVTRDGSLFVDQYAAMSLLLSWWA